MTNLTPHEKLREEIEYLFASATPPREIIEFVLSKLSSLTEERVRSSLEEYTDWLCKHHYTDSDVWAEEPKAVDRFLQGNREDKV